MFLFPAVVLKCRVKVPFVINWPEAYLDLKSSKIDCLIQTVLIVVMKTNVDGKDILSSLDECDDKIRMYSIIAL